MLSIADASKLSFLGLNAVNLIKSVIVMTANECGYKMYRYNLEVTYDKKRGNQDINDMFRGKIWRPSGFELRSIYDCL